MFQLPSTWIFHGSANNGNQVTYTRPGHTIQTPRIAIFDRSPASFNAGTGRWSVPTYRVRVIDGIVDAAGVPDPTKTLVDATFRYSINSDGASQGESVVNDFNTVVSATGFADSVFGPQDFPRPASA